MGSLTIKTNKIMRKSEVTPQFQMSFGDLMQLGDKADDLMERDAAELLPYGVDATYRTDTATLTDDLKNFPTDEELQAEVSEKTETKNLSADAVKVFIRSVMVRAKAAFGEASAKYRRFGTKGMDDLADNDLLKCGKRVVRVATFFQVPLAAKGLTPAMITDLDGKVTTFDNDIDAQDDAIRQRDNATEDRIELGNALYAKIVELFDYGKDYWVTRDEAKYNDYVIYDQPAGNHLLFDGPIAGMTIQNVLDATAVNEYVVGVQVRIKNTYSGPAIGGLYFYAAMNSGDGWSGLGQMLNPGQEATLTLDAMQYRPYFNVQNMGPNEQSWEVEIL